MSKKSSVDYKNKNKLKEYKHIWRIRQEYFDVLYMESTLIGLN